MAHFTFATVTDKGKDLLNESMAGRYVTVTKAEACQETAESVDALKKLTALSGDVKQTLSIVGDRVTEDGRTITIQVTNAETEYQLKQIGVFGKFKDTGDEILMYVIQEDPAAEDAQAITVTDQDGPPFFLDIYTHLNIGNELDKFEVAIDAEGAVNVQLMQETLEAHNTDPDAHLIEDDTDTGTFFRLGVDQGKLYIQTVEEDV